MAMTLHSSSPTVRGRRRALSRHRRSRSVRLPSGWSGFLHLGVPGLLLVLIGAGATAGFVLAPDHPGPLPAPLTLVAVLLAIPLVFAVALQVGLSPLAAVVAAALAVLAPPAVRASSVGVPEHLALLGLLAAVVLLGFAGGRWGAIPLAALGVGIAAALAPIALAAVPFLAWQARRVLRRSQRTFMLPVAGALLFATVAVGWAILGLDASAQPVHGTATIGTWFASNPVGTLLGAAALVFGLLTPSLRPLGGLAVTLLVLSIWPDGDEVTRYTVLLAPTFALLVGAAVDRAVAALGRAELVPRLIGIAAASVVALALATGVTASVLEVRERAVAADRSPTDPSSATPGTSGSASPAAAPLTTTPGERASRASAGSQLARNPRLTLSADAKQLLEEGSVDRRISVVLGQLLSEHDLTVADFPAGDPRDAFRRRVLVSEMDGEQLAPGGAPMTTLSTYLSGLAGTFAVESVTVDAHGVLATFPVTDPGRAGN
jgi:hypothetical protein